MVQTNSFRLVRINYIRVNCRRQHLTVIRQRSAPIRPVIVCSRNHLYNNECRLPRVVWILRLWRWRWQRREAINRWSAVISSWMERLYSNVETTQIILEMVLPCRQMVWVSTHCGRARLHSRARTPCFKPKWTRAHGKLKKSQPITLEISKISNNRCKKVQWYLILTLLRQLPEATPAPCRKTRSTHLRFRLAIITVSAASRRDSSFKWRCNNSNRATIIAVLCHFTSIVRQAKHKDSLRHLEGFLMAWITIKQKRQSESWHYSQMITMIHCKVAQLREHSSSHPAPTHLTWRHSKQQVMLANSFKRRQCLRMKRFISTFAWVITILSHRIIRPVPLRSQDYRN